MSSCVSYLVLSLFFFSHGFLTSVVGSQDVVGCGGFVRSKFPVDYTRVEVKVVTRSGVLKYKTDCAPNNGYFLIPLYDKGEFVLKVEPPQGWMFQPSEVFVKVDGKTDQCSRGEDIDFELLGFSVYGQVLSSGLTNGPRGVVITMQVTDDTIRETHTAEEGRFSFAGVVPGTYQLSASHETWSVSKFPVEVTVEDDSVETKAGLTVLGFDVRGHVFSIGEAVARVQLLLYTEDGLKVECGEEPIPDGPRDVKPSCAAVSDTSGEFVFLSLPPGNYSLLPHYRHGQIVFEVEPTVVHFTVYNESVAIKPSFEVQGFSVSGKVLRAKNSEGIAGARVFVNGKAVTRTGEEGNYQLFNITAGTYKIQIEASDVHFDPVDLQISPKMTYLPDIVPARYSVCGKVSIPVLVSASILASYRQIQVFTSAGDVRTTTTTDPLGEFCVMLAPGKYMIKADVSLEESQRGLLLQPTELPVTVEDSPINAGLVFTQFTGTLSGTITCIERCIEMEVTLTRDGREGQRLFEKVKAAGSEGSFKFDDVLPGNVTVSVQHEGWCWKEKSLATVVGPDIDPVLQFSQLGFVLECAVSHDIRMAYHTGNDSYTEVELKRGTNTICLSKPGDYTLNPKSCHKFDADTYIFKTSSPKQVVMNAIAHRVSAAVFSPKKTDVMTLKIRSLRFGAPEQHLSPEDATQIQGDTVLQTHHFSFMAVPGDELEVVPTSSDLMFVPQSRKHTVSEDCPERISLFEGSPGLILEGHIEPSLEGVAIIIELEDGETIQAVTSNKGEYRAGPIHGGKRHTVTANLDGYVLEPLSDDLYSFTALRLSKITIKVLTDGGNPLSGVLVSLSGANFRSNNFTREDGKLTYIQLNPGEYFLKPLLREYEFVPSSKMISLQQGNLEEITFTGNRVAFSCSGTVTSLNRQPQEGIMMEATSSGDASCEPHADESTTDSDGVYWMRGLMPGCEYVISVKGSEENGVERSLPTRRKVQLSTSNMEGVDFIVVYSLKSIIVTGNVITEHEHLHTLKLHVSSDGKNLHSLGVDGAGFFALSSLPMDKQAVYHLVLETNLSPHFYKFRKVETSFVADSDRHITLTFNAEERDLDHKPHEGSFIGIISTVVVIFVLFNIDVIFERVQKVLIDKQNSSDSAITSGESKKRTGQRRQ